MWMIDPKLMCKKHLLGEHAELHKHRHNFLKQHKMDKRISPVVQIEPASMQRRHDELAEEMIRRGYRHDSPYEQPDLSYLPPHQRQARVDLAYNLTDLMNRCEACRSRILAGRSTSG